MKNWVKLQREGSDDAAKDKILYSIVDLHSLSTVSTKRIAKPNGVMLPALAAETRTMTATLLACGIDPNKSIIYAQSHVPQHSQLYWLLGCLAPLGRLHVAPQFKVCEINQQIKRAKLINS